VAKASVGSAKAVRAVATAPVATARAEAAHQTDEVQAFEGAMGASAATWVGHYPWFVTHNFLEAYCVKNRILDAHLTRQDHTRKNLRRALVGVLSSLVSDVCSNAIRVLKTYKQTSVEPIGYLEAASKIIEKDGLAGLLFRGLSSKLAANAINAIIFTVVWKAISERLAKGRTIALKSS
jgi:hypothetical protein